MESAVEQRSTVETNGTNGHSANGFAANGHYDVVSAPVSAPPASLPIGRDLLEAQLRAVRESMERIEAAQLQHSEALRAAAVQWSEQFGFLRDRTEGLDDLSESQRGELLARIEQMQDELTRLNGFVIQTQIQERMINQVEEAHERTAEAVARMATANTELVDRIDRSFDDLKRRYDSRYRTLAVGVIAVMVATVWLVWSTQYLWVPR
jgi:hypothetical protein